MNLEYNSFSITLNRDIYYVNAIGTFITLIARVAPDCVPSGIGVLAFKRSGQEDP